ncbi:MAG: hypothetical protein JW751_27355 [Polyangiaceae bacterium]|nr:hypothetical protein [Polyangiaceae bacterium]
MTKLDALASASLLAGLTLAMTACTAKTIDRFDGTPKTERVDWVSGTDLHVTERNGIINVYAGDPDVVEVTFMPFTYRGYDEEEEAENEIENNLTMSADLGDPGVEVKVFKPNDGGSTSIGADVDIYIPPDFDAGIYIRTENGDVDINSVGQAVQLDVRNDGVGDCTVDGAPTVTYTRLWCSAVRVTDVCDFVDLQADMVNGNIQASLAGISGWMPDGEDRNILYTADGDIVLDLPADDGFIVQAVAFGGGVVNEGPVPEDYCAADESGDDENSKTVTCGDGPWFDLQAGVDDLGEGNIELRYH